MVVVEGVAEEEVRGGGALVLVVVVVVVPLDLLLDVDDENVSGEEESGA